MPRDTDRHEPPKPLGEKSTGRPLTEIEKKIAEEREWVQVPDAPRGIQRNRRTGMWRNEARTP